MNKRPYKDGFEIIKHLEQVITEKRYIEAIVLISSYIEAFLGLFISIKAKKLSKGKGFDHTKIENSIMHNSFDTNIKIASYLGIIDKTMYNTLNSFKSERNQLVHKMLKLTEKTDEHLKSIFRNGINILSEFHALGKKLKLY